MILGYWGKTMRQNGAAMLSVKSVLALTTTAAILTLAGCGKSSSGGGGGTPPPPIVVAFQTAPPSSVLAGSAPVSVSAVVTNDSASRGVDWLLTCTGGGDCGTLTPLHTDSGASTTYTPPANISGSSVTVNLVAFATSDHSSNAPSSFSVTSLNNALSGTYVFDVAGDNGGFPAHTAGVVVLNAGSVTGGEIAGDLASFVSDQISGGSYVIGPDGRGTLAINTASGLAFQYAFVVLSSSKALLNETDGTVGSGVGTLDLQTSQAPPSGSFAFSTVGADAVNFVALALGGVLNITTPGTVSVAGSVIDQNANGIPTTGSALSANGSVTAPDSFGKVTIQFTPSFATTPVQFNGYIVDASHIKLIESDFDPNTGLGFGFTAGTAISQGSAAGTFISASFSGPYVYGLLGQIPFGNWATSAWAGQVTADGSGGFISGTTDQDVGGTVIADATVSGASSYTVDSTGRAIAKLDYGSTGPGPSLIFYLTGNGSPALVLDTDTTATGAGVAYPQLASTPLSGTYGLSLTSNNQGTDNDITGQLIADVTNNTLSGQYNLDVFGTSGILGGTFSPGGNDRFPGTLSLSDQGGNLLSTSGGAFYVADPTQGFFIENDGTQVSLSYFSAQSALGAAKRISAHGFRARNHGASSAAPALPAHRPFVRSHRR